MTKTKEIVKANHNKFSIEFSGDDSFIQNIEMNIHKLCIQSRKH